MSALAHRAGPALALGLALLIPGEAGAVRFTLGLATELVPLIFESADRTPAATRFGLLPVIEVEPNPYLSIGTYTPFTLFRAGGSSITASSGAESVFGLQISGRYPVWRDRSPEELLFYGTFRGGFGTVDARAGPFFGFAAGTAMSWLESGAGLYGELGVGRLSISELSSDLPFVDRWWVGLTLGFVFRLGGERWRIDYQ